MASSSTPRSILPLSESKCILSLVSYKTPLFRFHNFLFKICGCQGDYTMASREEMCVEEIRRVVGDQKILVMVSGGVDSAVCAALLHNAIGKDRVCVIHIDTGFMRENESDQVVESLNGIGLDVKRIPRPPFIWTR